MKKGKETKKLEAWFKKRKSEGLKDIKFFAVNTDMCTVEDFCADVNKFNEAIETGSYTPYVEDLT